MLVSIGKGLGSKNDFLVAYSMILLDETSFIQRTNCLPCSPVPGFRRVAFILSILVIHLSSAPAQKSSSAPRSNVILITVDTLRPDHLGCYGYKAIRTPHIDKLALEGARFTTVVAQVPQTLPSHCSILTGTYPMFHQVRANV